MGDGKLKGRKAKHLLESVLASIVERGMGDCSRYRQTAMVKHTLYTLGLRLMVLESFLCEVYLLETVQRLQRECEQQF